jgi:hypothetical protein
MDFSWIFHGFSWVFIDFSLIFMDVDDFDEF